MGRALGVSCSTGWEILENGKAQFSEIKTPRVGSDFVCLHLYILSP